MAIVQGIFRAANQDVPGATAYLIPASFYTTPPNDGDPIPVSAAIATAITNQNGTFLFTNQPDQSYWVGCLFDGLTGYQFFADISFTTITSGQISANAPGGLLGNILGIQYAGAQAFSIYTSGGVITNPAASNLTEYVSGGATQYQLVNAQGVAPVSGIMTGAMILNVPDNCTAMQFMKTQDLSGSIEIRLGDQWALRTTGPHADFSRGHVELWDYHMPNPHGAPYGSAGFRVDSDHQAHFICYDDTGTGGGEIIFIEHHTNKVPVPNNLTTSIVFGLPNNSNNIFRGGLVQAQASAQNQGSETSSMNIYRIENGVGIKALAIREHGEFAVLQGGSGYITVLNEPAVTHNYGLLSLGGGGFVDHSISGNFSGQAGGTGLAINFTPGSLADYVNFQRNGAPPIFRIDPIGQTYLAMVDSANNAVSFPLHIKHLPNVGTPAPGEGVGIQFSQLNDTSLEVVAGEVYLTFDGTTTGNEKSFFSFTTTSGSILSDTIRLHHTRDIQYFGASYSNSAPDANVNRGLINIGDGTFSSKDGVAGTGSSTVFSGTNQGTYLAINAASGATANLCDFQLAGSSKFKVLPNGKACATGGLGAGNKVTRTTLASPGTITGQLEVFDASGTSIGSVPIYSNGSYS